MADGTTPEILRTTRDQVVGLRADRTTIRADLATATTELLAAESAARTASDRGGAVDTTAIGAARGRRAELLEKLATVDLAERGLIDALSVIDPCDADADVPLVLLPIRIETRYTEDLASLQVRLYPDEAHLDRLDEGLTDAERSAAVSYWRTIWSGGSPSEADAWAALVRAVKADRAAWVSDATRPTNLADRPADDALPGAIEPQLPATFPAGSGAVVARGLPDRFVVTVIQGGQPRHVTGSAVPPELTVGLPRRGTIDDLPIDETLDLPIAPGTHWLVDPVEAAKVGMAVTVPLAVAGGPIDRVIVTGLRTSLGDEAGGRELEQVLRAHRYTTGLAFVPQGTVTNNADGPRSPWSSGTVAEPRPTRVVDPAAPATNASRMAAALGIAPEVLDGVRDGALTEDLDARNANAALWAASWGAFFDRIMVNGRLGPTVPDFVREWARTLFIEDVRGRGPLPTLRVGAQPYGVLPVAAVDRRWKTGDSTEAALVGLLHRARSMWVRGLESVPRVMGSPEIDKTVVEILGSTAVQLGFRVRSVATETTMSFTGPAIPGTAQEQALEQQHLDQLAWSALGFRLGEIGLKGALGSTTRPLGLPLVAASDRAWIQHLLDPNAPGATEIESVLQALLAIGKHLEETAVSHAGPPDRMAAALDRAQVLVADGAIQTKVAATIGSLAAGTVERSDIAESIAALDTRVQPAGEGLLATLQPISAIRGSLVEVSEQADLEPALSATISLQAISAFLRTAGHLDDFRSAIGAIAAMDDDGRRLVVAEALDCASHRLDAWLTALASRRLRLQRRVAPVGAVLGAYGWVEGLAPGRVTSQDGGYVHAPSVSHAATAGILRNAYLTHNPNLDSHGSFAIDLSSARVRLAFDVLDGIAQGQPLGALLGYRFERGLHEAGLDRFTRSVRALAPIVATKLTDRGEDLPEGAKEAIAANNVVDGVRLHGLAAEVVIAALDDKPKDNPYLEDVDWTGPTEPEKAAIRRLLGALDEQLDAVADVLVAESVHQLVGGNVDRAAAAIESLSGGSAPPVSPEVVRTPSRGVAVGHRLLIVLGSSPDGTAGWNTDAPRARLEPRLEAWAEQRLGPAESIFVGRGAGGMPRTIAGTRLCALDVVFSAGAPELLIARLLAAHPDLDAAALRGALASTDLPDGLPDGSVGWTAAVDVARTLAAIIAGSELALGSAFARPSDAPAREIDVAEIGELLGRIGTARADLQVAIEALEAEIPSDVDAGGPGAPAAATPAAVEARAALAAYGIGLPAGVGSSTVGADRALAAEGRRRVALADAAIGRTSDHANKAANHRQAAAQATDAAVRDAASAHARAFLDRAATAANEAAGALFGDGFRLLPLVRPPATADLFSAAAAVAIGPEPLARESEIRRFLLDMASVRPRLDDYADLLVQADALRRAPRHAVVQLATSRDPGVRGWIAKPFADDQPTPASPVTSVVIEVEDDFDPERPLAGLVVDDWSEVLPVRVTHRGDAQTRGSDALGTDPLVTTGIALNANGPDARPPQAILLAVSPDGDRWTTDRLIDTLEETLELAKLRLVSLERVALAGRVMPALQVQSWSLQGDEPALDLATIVTTLARADKMVRFVKDS